MEKYAKLLEMIGYHQLQLVKNCKKTGLHQFRAVAVAVMSILGNKKLVRSSVALFGGKKPDWTGPENTTLNVNEHTIFQGYTAWDQKCQWHKLDSR